jgi:hypothetical protein
MEPGSTDKRIWTRVSEDGKHAAAGMDLGACGCGNSATPQGDEP